MVWEERLHRSLASILSEEGELRTRDLEKLRLIGQHAFASDVA